ncbi:hypothetical protein LCGC14_1629630, partial [marine sediment metagenome]
QEYAAKAKFFLEVGTASGVTISLLSAENPQVTFVSIDLYNPSIKSTNERILWWRLNNRPPANLWIGTFQQFEMFCNPNIFDTIWIDARHSDKSVYEDLNSARELLVSGGVILSHDYGLSETNYNYGATSGADRWLKDNANWSIIEQEHHLIAMKRRNE